MQEDFEYDDLTIRAPQRTRWYTRLWSACRCCGCVCRKKRQFSLNLIGYDPVGRLQRAAGVGDVALVERLINAREHHVNECDRRRRSPLHYASAHNHPNVVRLLSSNDCTDINMKDDEGCTPLIKASQRDNLECISVLLMYGADPNIVDDSGDAALHHAICRGNIPVVRKLLEYNVDIKAKTEYGLTPYKLALFKKQLRMAQFLIDSGADAYSGLTPYSGGAAAVELEPSTKKCANINKEENFSTDIKPSCSAVRPARQLKSLLKKSFQIKRAGRRRKDQISLSEGTITREPEQRKKKCVTFNDEIHYNTDKKPFCRGIRPPGELKPILRKSLQISGDNGRNQDQIILGEGTITREPEQRKKKCVTFNDEIHYNTDKKPFCRGIRPPGELKPILRKSLQISGDNGRNQDQTSLRLSENNHVKTEDKATNTKEDIDNSSSRYTIIQKQIMYSKKIAAMKKRDQEGLSKSVIDLSTLGEALPDFPRKKSCLMVERKKEEGFLPPANMHDIMPQPPAHANVTSTSHVSERDDNLKSSEETTVNTTNISERGDNLQSSEETTVNTTNISERGDNLQSSEETTVNTVSKRGDNLQSSQETTVNTSSVSERGDNRQSCEETTVNTTNISKRGDNLQSSEETTVNTTNISERGDNLQSSEETTVNTTNISERGDNRQSSEETTLNTTNISERGDNLQSSEETTVNTTNISKKGDNRQSSEETTVNNTSMDHTPSLGDALDPQNACMQVLDSSRAVCTSYAGNTHSIVFSVWATTTSLLLLTSLMWLLQLVALIKTWILNLF